MHLVGVMSAAGLRSICGLVLWQLMGLLFGGLPALHA